MSLNSKMTALADQMRALRNGADLLTIDAMTIGVTDTNNEILSQSELITLIQETLNDKTEDFANLVIKDGFEFNNPYILKIGNYAFYKHQSLATATFTAATEIGDYSFYQCPSLTGINTPLVETIGAFAFKDCSVLNTVNFANVIAIGNGAFDECSQLSSVTLDSLKEVAPLMFRKCANLNTVDLPAVNKIGLQAFYDSGLISLTLRANSVCELEDASAFYFTPIEKGTGYIYVPANLVDSYKTDSVWSVYANQIRAIG